MKHIAVVGAGPSGILALLALKPLADEKKVHMVAFEKQSTFGGLWNYSDETGLDRWGETCPGSIYRDMWINCNRFCDEIPDFLQPEDWPSYVPRERFTEWFQNLVNHFDLQQYMELDTRVEGISYGERSQKFSVTTRGFGQGCNTRRFDYVAVATGHFSFPNDPHFEGIHTFPGKIMHSHDYRNGRDFKGQRVLIIGGAFSAEDIALQLWKFEAAHVTVSARKPTGHDWPPGVTEKPLLNDVVGSTVHFLDSTSGVFDVIIKCTGYEHRFPFMAKELQLHTGNVLMPPLYKATVFPSNKQLFYLGMMNQIYTFPYSLAQGRFLARVVAGDIQLPSDDEMQTDVAKEIEAARPAEESGDLEVMLKCQTGHVNYLTDACGLERHTTEKQFSECIAERSKSLVHYRDTRHWSRYTGMHAPPLPDSWVNLVGTNFR